jgi:predicted cupin superfamily sugar epimerase
MQMPSSTDTSASAANLQLIKKLGLQLLDPEGGYFVETDRSERSLQDAYGSGTSRDLHSTIYYLLTPEHPHSFFHSHAADSLHFSHHGKARFTCFKPPSAGSDAVEFRQYVLGSGEGASRQVKVPGGWWRFIELLEDEQQDDEHRGMLMSEVCVLGFE